MHNVLFKCSKMWEFNKLFVVQTSRASENVINRTPPPARFRELRLDLYYRNCKRLPSLSLFFKVSNKAFFFQKHNTYLQSVPSLQTYLVTTTGFNVLLNTFYAFYIPVNIISANFGFILNYLWYILQSRIFFAINYNTLVNFGMTFTFIASLLLCKILIFLL